MPGAGFIIATNNIYNVATPDGLTVSMPNYGAHLDQLVGRKEVQFDRHQVALDWFAGKDRRRVICALMRRSRR